MLSMFPDFLTYDLLAPVIIRAVLGLTYIFFAYNIFFKKKGGFFRIIGLKRPSTVKSLIGLVELVGGVLIFIGLFIQIAALAMSALMFGHAYTKYRRGKKARYFILLAFVSLSLFFSGAGLFAIDLPL